MGCVSSKILSKSGSIQEKVNQSLQRSSMIEEIVLSNSKTTGDQFLALLCTTSSAPRRIRAPPQAEPEAAAQCSTAPIETIDVSDLLAGLEEDTNIEQEHHHQEANAEQSHQANSARCCSGRAKSFRTVEDYDALVAESHTLEEEEEEEEEATEAAKQELCREPEATEEETGREMVQSSTTGGAKRRARAREVAELKVPAFEFGKSGSLREWLLRGGQIFSPGSYVTPKFGTTVASEGGGHSGEHAVFDPELVAQFERAMEQLSMDEERILQEIVEGLEEGEGEERSKEPTKV